MRYYNNPCGLSGSTDLYSISNGRAYHVSIGLQSNFSSIKPLIDNILSTFKFTNNQTVDTSDWKTYDGNYFAFKYPGTYTLDNSNANVVSVISPIIPKKGSEGFSENELKIEILYPKMTSQTLKEIVDTAKKQPNEHGNEPLKFEETSLKIGNEDAAMLTSQYSNVIYIIHNNKLTQIIGYPPTTSRQTEFDQILSTFKFTN